MSYIIQIFLDSLMLSILFLIFNVFLKKNRGKLKEMANILFWLFIKPVRFYRVSKL